MKSVCFKCHHNPCECVQESAPARTLECAERELAEARRELSNLIGRLGGDEPAIHQWGNKAPTSKELADEVYAQAQSIAQRETDFARTLERELAEARQQSNDYRSYLYGCDKHQLWKGLSCIGCIEQERDSLRQQLGDMEKARSEWKADNKDLRTQITTLREALRKIRNHTTPMGGSFNQWHAEICSMCNKALT